MVSVSYNVCDYTLSTREDQRCAKNPGKPENGKTRDKKKQRKIYNDGENASRKLDLQIPLRSNRAGASFTVATHGSKVHPLSFILVSRVFAHAYQTRINVTSTRE